MIAESSICRLRILCAWSAVDTLDHPRFRCAKKQRIYRCLLRLRCLMKDWASLQYSSSLVSAFSHCFFFLFRPMPRLRLAHVLRNCKSLLAFANCPKINLAVYVVRPYLFIIYYLFIIRRVFNELGIYNAENYS
jgi:hypothetical protein